MRATIISAALMLACCGEADAGASLRDAKADAGTRADPPHSPSVDRRTYEQRVSDLETRRHAMATALQTIDDPTDRARHIDNARNVAIKTIVEDLLPAWYGTPWAMNGTATHPGDEPIACGYFVSTLLRDAGFSLHRVRFGQAAALRIQKATTPSGRKVHRFFSIPPASLAHEIAALGDGLYIIGLNVHVGFVVVDGGDVGFVHSSYTGDRQVSNEPLAEAQAIANSQPAGYFVSELLTTDDAVKDWLTARPLTLPES